MPMFLRALRNFPDRNFTMFSPLSHISPDVGVSSRFTHLIRVLLPEPEGKNGEPPHPQAQRHHEERSMAIFHAWGKEKEAWGHDHTFEQKDDTYTSSWPVTIKRGNKWLAYNAVQGAEQHYINAGYKPRRLKNQHKALVKAVDGKSRLGDKALALLTKG